MQKFLIVDDSKAIRFLLRRFLEDLGHSVVGEAVDGKEALKRYKELKPDVITLDLVMPGLSGIEVLKTIRSDAPEMKVFVVTSAASLSNMMSTQELGAHYFLVKPFRREDVEKAIYAIGAGSTKAA